MKRPKGAPWLLHQQLDLRAGQPQAVDGPDSAPEKDLPVMFEPHRGVIGLT